MQAIVQMIDVFVSVTIVVNPSLGQPFVFNYVPPDENEKDLQNRLLIIYSPMPSF